MSVPPPLDAERWDRAARIAEELFDVPVEEHSARLAQLAADDPSLRELAIRMLNADREQRSLLDRGLEGVAAIALTGEESDGNRDADLAGRRIGPYRLQRLLGRGGMGIVYLAERDDGQYRMQVALKLLPLGVHTPETRRRFLAERQVLANLAHPNVARLLDGGIAEDGTPYFAMEHVEGSALDAHCDEHRLPVHDRLELFRAVCQAVQYAHQNLVVHRDLKPSNILIDRTRGVKLLDFGIAKLLEEGEDPDRPETRTAHRLLTPRFAAPEQLTGGAVTTATDVYALGVVLFELLTGRSPYRAHGHDVRAMEHEIVADEPLRPSQAVLRMPDEDARTAAAARGTTPDRLRRALEGDLDRVVLKALEKEPARRYATAQALEDDIRRHLGGEMITARHHGIRYRASRFAKRHRVWVVVAAVMLVTLVSGLAAALSQAAVARRERDAAQREAARAERVSDFLVDIFRAADPEETPRDSITARDVLDRARQRMTTELAADPATLATFMDAMSRTYRSLGVHGVGRELADSALAIRERLLVPRPADILASLLTAGNAANAQGNRAAAESLYRRAVVMAEELHGPDHPELARPLTLLGQVVEQPPGDSSASLHRRALQVLRPTTDAEHRILTAAVMNSLGLNLHSRARYAEAESLYQQAVAIQRDMLGEGHPTTLTTLSNQAWVRQLAGDLTGAAATHEEILAARRATYGDRHLITARSLAALAEVVYLQGNYDSAATLNRQVLVIRGEHYPAHSASVLYGLHMLARSLAAAGVVEEPDSLYREGMLRARDAGLRTVVVARMINDYGTMLEARGRGDRAESIFRAAWEIYRDRGGADHPFTAIVLGNVAGALRTQGKFAAAESLYRASLGSMLKSWPDTHPTVAATRMSLGNVLADQGRHRDAEPLLRAAVDVLERGLPADHWRLALARARLGRALASLGRSEDGERLLLEGHRVLTLHRTARQQDWLEVTRHLLAFYERQGRGEQVVAFRTLLRGGG